MDYLAPTAQSLPITTDDAIRPTSTINCARQLRGFQRSSGTNVLGDLLSSLYLGSFFFSAFPAHGPPVFQADNSFGQTPCLVSAYLLLPCGGSSLSPHYSTPCFHCLFRKYYNSSSGWWSLQSGRIRSLSMQQRDLLPGVSLR
jgi:hypothetical protein